MAYSVNESLKSFEKYVLAVNIALGEHDAKLKTVASSSDFVDIKKALYGENGTAADAKEGSLVARVTANEESIDTNTAAIAKLNGDANTAGSVAKAIADLKITEYLKAATFNDYKTSNDANITNINSSISNIRKAIEGTGEENVIDTLAEVFDWIDAHDSSDIVTGLAGVYKSVYGTGGTADAPTADGLVKLVDTNKTAIAANTAAIAKLNGDANTAGSVAKAIADLNLATTYAKLTDFNTYKTNNDASVDALQEEMAKLTGTGADSIDKKIDDAIVASDASIIGLYVKKADIYGSGTAAAPAAGSLAKDVADNKAAITVLNGNATTAGSVDKKIADKITDLALDTTYVKLSVYNPKVTAIDASIDRLDSSVSALEKVVEDNEKVCAAALNDLFVKITTLEADVNAKLESFNSSVEAQA